MQIEKEAGGKMAKKTEKANKALFFMKFNKITRLIEKQKKVRKKGRENMKQ